MVENFDQTIAIKNRTEGTVTKVSARLRHKNV